MVALLRVPRPRLFGKGAEKGATSGAPALSSKTQAVDKGASVNDEELYSSPPMGARTHVEILTHIFLCGC